MTVRFSCILMGGVVLLALFGIALAADKPANDAGTPTQGEIILPSSQASDLNVYEQQDTSRKLGNIDNLIVYAHTGRVLYAVLDTGVGGKKVIVPWSVFQLRTSTSDSSKHFLVLNKTSHDLKSAPTFRANRLAVFTDSHWVGTIDKFFSVRSTMPTETVKRPGMLSVAQMIFQSSTLSDMNVYNRNDPSQKLGNIDNLIVDTSNGRVLYGILDTGVGGKNVPVPWNAFLLEKGTGKHNFWLTLNKTPDDLKNAPSIEKGNITDLAQWRRSVDEFFGVRTAARPTH
ncbi:MAG: PRC-barrel domain-containing protein [Planctomycetaceae bacterium]|nr:PRC-barrel domain-containing protein [Planctomycetaceae bacterium]